MKKIVADFHMHTIVSGHAYGTIREMVVEARKQNNDVRKVKKFIGMTE